MKNKILLSIIFLFIYAIAVYAQPSGRVKVVGDSLVGKMIAGQNIREVIGNVVITQEDIEITCEKAVQYLSKNDIELIGNVVAKKDSITLFTKRGWYFGNSQTAYSDSGIILNDGHIILSANKGYNLFEENRAIFYENVELFDSAKTLFADKLNYFNDIDKAIATGNVLIADSTSAIEADSLIHNRLSNISRAFNNVKISSPDNNIIITAEHLEDFGNEDYTKLSINPLLTQIDTSTNGQIDTLYISSKTMEAVTDSVSKLIAKDSVKILRGGFSSVNSNSIYFTEEDKILTFKNKDEKQQPVLWYETSQLLGDSVYIYLKNNNIKKIEINKNASIFSQSQFLDYRFDQISGDTVWLNFNNSALELTEVFGKVLSIYYVLEEDESNGLVKASADRAQFIFEKNSVSKVKMYGDPDTEYHPEILIEGKEKEFTLPSFIIFENRPDKKSVLKGK